MTAPVAARLDDYVSAFEADWADEPARIDDHLPPSGHPLFLPVLRELVRIDLELGWTAGRPMALGQYLERYPDLARDARSVQEIAYEEYRLRLQARQCPRPEEYAAAFGVNTAGWFSPAGSSKPDRLATTRITNDGVPRLSFEVNGDHDPATWASRCPTVGGTFAGFRLEEELGRGSFARVFLAREESLSARPVVLKLCPATFVTEAHTLARLQHTHIVPIYSLHTDGPLAGLCMPFFGTVTLAGVLRKLRQASALPRSGDWLRGCLPAARSVKWPQMSHVASSLWLVGRLAEGLAHAHARGILHRDIKPANLLLADDGTPMLLDFNLADDEARGDGTSRAGGTLPYMAPEYLDALRRGEPLADPRCDLFALGLVLYELLTARFPFPAHKDATADLLPVLASERRVPYDDPRLHNPAVDAGTAAIVRKCLEPDPAKRYATAADLVEDIDRHLTHQPLKHVREPIRQRLRKWAKRHPAMTSSASIAAVAAGVVLVLGTLVVTGVIARQRLGAERELTRLREGADQLPFLLSHRTTPAQLDEGLTRCRELAAGFSAETRDDWQDASPFRHLSLDQRDEARRLMGETLWLWARADAWRKGKPDDESWRLLDRAAACYRANETPGVLSAQRATWLEQAGQTEEANSLRAALAEPRSPREHYLEVLHRAGEGRWSQTLPMLRQLTRSQGDRPTPWLLLASAHAELGQPDQARFCAEVGTSLAPEWSAAWFHQGVLALHRQDHRTARECFTKVLDLRPAMHEARLNLALAELGRDNASGALAHLDRLIENEAPISRIYLIRARAHQRLGDAESAKRDIEHGRKITPTDETGWHARAVAWLPDDPASARADLNQILSRDPDSPVGLQNRAHVLAEHLHRPADAVKDLDRLLRLRPDDGVARAGRAVLLARLGRRAEAHDDARLVEEKAEQAALLYQAACAFALTAKTRRGDRHEALRLLRKAFAQEARWIAVAPKDDDLAALHADADFLDLLKRAQAWYRDAPGVR